jgi:hypothetical protein
MYMFYNPHFQDTYLVNIFNMLKYLSLTLFQLISFQFVSHGER